MSGSRIPLKKAAVDNRPTVATQAEATWPFYLVLMSLVFEFGRPQELIPLVKAIPIPTILNALIGYSFLVARKPQFSNRQTRLWIPLLVLMFIHVPLAVNNFHALMILKGMILLFALYLGIITYVQSVPRIRTLARVWTRIHIILAALGIAAGGVGLGGWIGDENDFCMAINMVIPFPFFMIFSAEDRRTKAISIGLLVLFVLTVMITLSRGGFIGLAAIGAYCWLWSPRKGGALVLVAIVVAFMLVAAPDKYWGEIKSSFSEEELEQGTGADRLYMWGIGLEMFLANPIIGVGQGNFPWTFEEYEAGRTHDDKSRAGRAAHSLYLTLLPEMGLVGTFLFLAMLVRNFGDVRLVERTLRIELRAKGVSTEVRKDATFILGMIRAIEGSIVGFLVTSIFISTLWYPSFWVMMGMLVAVRNVAVERFGNRDVRNQTLVLRTDAPVVSTVKWGSRTVSKPMNRVHRREADR